MMKVQDPSKSAPDQWVAVAALVGVNALWGLSFPIMKSLNLHMEQFFDLDNGYVPSMLSVAFSSGMIAMRFFVSFLILLFACPRLIRGASPAEWRVGFLVGLLFYVGLVLQVIGLATIPASRSGFLTSLTAVFTPIIGAVFFRRAISVNVVVGVAIALFGVAILTGLLTLTATGFHIASDSLSKWTLGDTLTTLGAVLFTGQLLLVDHFGSRINSTAITPGMFLTVTVAASGTFLMLHATSLGSVPLHLSSPWLAWTKLFATPVFGGIVLFLALFCSVLAFLGMNKYQPHISAVQASIVYSSEPVFASLWALFLPSLIGLLDPNLAYPNEVVSTPLLVGGAGVLLANVVALWPRKYRSE
jgi:drug/metabolite transporter (DMT)-like permease